MKGRAFFTWAWWLEEAQWQQRRWWWLGRRSCPCLSYLTSIPPHFRTPPWPWHVLPSHQVRASIHTHTLLFIKMRDSDSNISWFTCLPIFAALAVSVRNSDVDRIPCVFHSRLCCSDGIENTRVGLEGLLLRQAAGASLPRSQASASAHTCRTQHILSLLVITFWVDEEGKDIQSAILVLFLILDSC